jgi:hypothetical protein
MTPAIMTKKVTEVRLRESPTWPAYESSNRLIQAADKAACV